MNEKRRYLRFDLLLDAIFNRGNKREKIKITNFSREGLSILSDNEICAGDDICIEMNIPGDNIPITVSGRIAWSQEKREDDEFKYEGGVEISPIKSNEHAKILNYIYERFMRLREKSKK
jgi:hypothetical protein